MLAVEREEMQKPRLRSSGGVQLLYCNASEKKKRGRVPRVNRLVFSIGANDRQIHQSNVQWGI